MSSVPSRARTRGAAISGRVAPVLVVQDPDAPRPSRRCSPGADEPAKKRLCGRVVRVLNWPVMKNHNLVGPEGQHRVRAALVVTELDFEDGRRQFLDNS